MIILANKHFRDALKQRTYFNDVEELLKGDLSFLYGHEDNKKGKQFIKNIIMIKKTFYKKGKEIEKYFFVPFRHFIKDGVDYFKLLTVLDEKRYFTSFNLLFGKNKFVKKIKDYEIVKKDVYFQDEESASMPKNVEFNSEYEIVSEIDEDLKCYDIQYIYQNEVLKKLGITKGIIKVKHNTPNKEYYVRIS